MRVVKPPSLAWRLRRCAAEGAAVLPARALGGVDPVGVARVAVDMADVARDARREALARRVVARIRERDLLPVCDERGLARMARTDRRERAAALYMDAIPALCPRWTWYEQVHVGGDAPTWLETMLYAAISHDVEGYHAAHDMATADERADDAMVAAIVSAIRPSYTSTVTNGGNYFWSERDRVDGRIVRPGDIGRAVARDVAGAFAREPRPVCEAPAYIIYVAGNTGNLYLDVAAEEWEGSLRERLPWSPAALREARRLWREAHELVERYRAIHSGLRTPAVWPAFLRAWRATLDWCSGPGAHDI